MLFIWLAVLSFLLIQATSQEKETNSLTNKSLIDLSNEGWSEWSKCSDSCGGCGIQNRTLTLPNGTHIVHVRHCNPKPCVNEEEPCCEPFQFTNGKCLIPEKIQNDKPKYDDSQNQRKEAVVAWKSIKGDEEVELDDSKGQRKEAVVAWKSIKGDEEPEFDDSKSQRKEAIVAWESIEENTEPELDDRKKEALLAWNKIKEKFPNSKTFGNTNSNETNTPLNTTSVIKTTLNNTGNPEDNITEGSGEFDIEMVNKINNTEILTSTITNTDTPHASKKTKKKDSRNGYGRKDYKQRQRRYRHLPRTISKSQNADKSGKSQKMFDTLYEYDYYDYYYYY